MNNNLQLVLKSSTTEMSLNDHSAGIYLTPELDGLTGLPEIRTTSGVNAGYDGGWTSAQKFDARSIVIRGTIANNDKTEVERMRRELVALLAQGKNEQLELDFVTETGRAYEVQVRTIACDMALQKVLTQQDFMITLRADDPLIYDNSSAGEEATVNISGATGGFRIPFEIPLAIDAGSEETLVENTGLEAVAPTVKMYGALHNPKIINHTTNQSMQIQAELGFAEGDWITPSEPVEGKDLTINGAPENALIADFGIKGNTSQQTYSGKNLCGIPDQTFTHQGVGVTIKDNEITLNGTANGTGIRNISLIKTTVLNGNYTTDIVYVSGSATNSGANINLRRTSDHSLVGGTQVDIKEYNNYRAYSVSNENVEIGLYINPNGAVFNNLKFKVQIVAGSTPDYTFEPYTNGPAPNPDYPQAVQTVTGENTLTISDGTNTQSYEVNLGKNLFDKDNASEVINAYIDTAAHKITAGNNYRTAFISCEPNTTYTISKTLSARFIIATTTDMPANNVSVSQDIAKNTDTTYTITTNSTAKYLCVFCYHSSYDTLTPEQILATLQIEKGSQVTSYAAYFAPIELCKIGTYQDYIYKSGDKWYVHKEVGHTIKDLNILGMAANNNTGTTTVSDNGAFVLASWEWGSDYSSTAGRMLLSANIGTYKYDSSLIGNSQAQTMADGTFCQRQGTNDRVYFRDTAAIGKTGDQMKAILFQNGGGSDVWYSLATPTDTEITNAALVAQLEAILQEAKMYNPQTNITTLYADGNEQGTLKVSYFTDKNPDVRDELIIDSRLRTITLNGLDVYHLQAPGSEFLMLAPGENKLSLQSDIVGDNGYAKVSYKQGYLSI